MAGISIEKKRYNNFEFINPYIIRVQAHNREDIWFLVDTITWLWLHRFCWTYDTGNANYIVTRIGSSKFLYHIVMISSPSNYRRDHIDRNKLNNTYSNLRVVTISDNNRNTGLNSLNTTGYKGVYSYHLSNNELRWKSVLKINGKYYSKEGLTKEEAIQQRALWEQQYRQIIPIETPRLINPDGSINPHYPFNWYTERYLAFWWALGIRVVPYYKGFKMPNIPYYVPNANTVSIILNTLKSVNYPINCFLR